jgi:LPXTG-motif cell wall-anchored protein
VPEVPFTPLLVIVGGLLAAVAVYFSGRRRSLRLG